MFCATEICIIYMAWLWACILTNSFWFRRRPPYYGLSRSLGEGKATYLQTPKVSFHCRSCEGSGWSVTPCKTPTFSLPVNASKQIIKEKNKKSLIPIQSGLLSLLHSCFKSSNWPFQPNESSHTPHQLHLSAGPLDTKVWTTRRRARNSSRT